MAITATPAVLLLLLCTQIGYATSLSFFYNFSDPTSLSEGDLSFQGDAFAGDGSVVLGKDPHTGDVRAKAGRVTYSYPVHLWGYTTGEEARFSTAFSFVMNGGDTGGGLAFFLALYPSKMPLNSEGRYLGLFNSSTESRINKSGGEWIIAVEFVDTHGDTGLDSTSSPHIAVEMNTILSGKHKYMSRAVDFLGDGAPKTVQIDYSNATSALVVTLLDSTAGASLTLNTSVELMRYLPQEIAIGFSAATGESKSGVHEVFWWSFNTNKEETTVLLAPPLAGRHLDHGAPHSNKLVVGTIVGGVLFVVIFIVACLLGRWKKLA